ncbi:Hypothetical predicted protein [Paramuricea clavata]|uniref:Uncharacterized protein n=1 Tax=Paramuricea clavata TaxID=317549 RepID=A0A6S7JCX0_PARCT|nr:Hypothetical predicted protein [Paramuricea clavata]
MESRGIIKKVNEPTAWVNSMVVNEKRSGKLRICIDPRDLNKVLRREHYQLPTQQEITSRLTDAKFFSKLDANSGFWQMPLDEESSYLSTFNTPFGRYRFTVIPFGVVFAQEVFHKTVNEKFHDLLGCEKDIDDILIWGRTLEEHDQNLERVLNRVADINMTLSKDKFQFPQTKITYLGETLTANGVKPDETKVEAIKNYPKPTNKHDVQRLLGMVNYIAKFAPNISDVTAPLRELIKKNVAFHWLETHEKAFRDLQHLLTDPATLRYYNVAKPVTLQVDASQNGLGAALIQNQGPAAYASKAMNDTQRRYVQIEKELLTVVFACKRFHHYVYGKTITVESDHKPPEAILNKPLSQAPSRLQKMLMQLQAYDINLVYKKGSEMYIADALSRAFPPEIIPEQFEEDVTSERFIHLMSSESYVTDRKLQAIKDEIHTNETMQLLVKQIQYEWPDPDIPKFLNFETRKHGQLSTRQSPYSVDTEFQKVYSPITAHSAHPKSTNSSLTTTTSSITLSARDTPSLEVYMKRQSKQSRTLQEKYKVANQDPYLVLLDYRNTTPIDGDTKVRSTTKLRNKGLERNGISTESQTSTKD